MSLIFHRHETTALPVELVRVAVRPRPDSAVRLISPEAQREQGIEPHAGRHTDQEMAAAVDQLRSCREATAEARAALARAERAATEAAERAEKARVEHERARDEARSTDVALRRQQRATNDARLELRRALEWVARLEVFDAV
ncbi:MAG: hypothetical protein ACXWCM_01715 [Acidimicrobiales bacterium]